jgi:hypothetical protein
MRRTAARLNRTWLTILGLVLVLAGAAGLLVALGQATPLLQRAGLGWQAPQGDRRLFGQATAEAFGTTWVVVVTAVVGVVVGLLALGWLLAQVPRKHEARPFRLQDDAATGQTTVSASVLTDAVEAHATSLPGVDAASAVLRGGVERPDLTLRVTVDDRADVPRVLERVHTEVAGALATSLDTPLARLGVQVEVSGARSSKGRVTVVPQRT